ncbi:hypothetical protein CCACVL1_14646 [Corchorus capsularis]|uniref:Uncharacterized protein n=1 Tax=Corchorus capsularis TaxID=210143 RepID=A0A1R3I6J7_COCAP|nr:hypothetical protein CCACVL1_14646 [Corchorus capsularis]
MSLDRTRKKPNTTTRKREKEIDVAIASHALVQRPLRENQPVNSVSWEAMRRGHVANPL